LPTFYFWLNIWRRCIQVNTTIILLGPWFNLFFVSFHASVPIHGLVLNFPMLFVQYEYTIDQALYYVG